jgi:hypothetical protein
LLRRTIASQNLSSSIFAWRRVRSNLLKQGIRR